MRGFYKRTFRQHHSGGASTSSLGRGAFQLFLCSQYLVYFFRHEALEEEEECLFSKLTALVCVNRFLLLIFLVLELAHGHEHLREGVCWPSQLSPWWRLRFSSYKSVLQENLSTTSPWWRFRLHLWEEELFSSCAPSAWCTCKTRRIGGGGGASLC